MSHRRIPFLALPFLTILLAVLLALAGCNDEGSSDLVPVSGLVVDGAISGAAVRAFRMDENGTLREALSEVAVSGQDGVYALKVRNGLRSSRDMVMIRSSGGAFTDWATGRNVTLAAEDHLESLLPRPDRAATVHITPLTHMAAYRAQALIRAGTSTVSAVATANQGLSSHFGAGDILAVTPFDPTSAGAVTGDFQARDYGLVLAGIAQSASQQGVHPFALVQALARDAEDGRFNGRQGSSRIYVQNVDAQGQPQTGARALNETAATSGLATAMATFQNSARNRAGVAASTPVTSGLSASTGRLDSQGNGTYVSPYSLVYTCTLASLTPDFSTSPRGNASAESTDIPHAQWYNASAYADRTARAWGPHPRQFAAPAPAPAGCNLTTWKQQRVIASALQYQGYHYQHHHIPDWDPSPYPGWPYLNTTLGHQSKGLDCSDLTSWAYNFGLGIKLNSDIAQQASSTSIPPAGGAGANTTATVPLRATSTTAPMNYTLITSTLATGDLLYIRPTGSAPLGDVSHVIIWVGSIGSPSSTPLILDSHDNSPAITDQNGAVIPAGTNLRPFKEGDWYHRRFDHAHRIIN